MKISDKYSLEIQAVMNDIEHIKKGHIYEKDSTPGMPECETLGARLETNFMKLIRRIENNAKGDIEVVTEYLK